MHLVWLSFALWTLICAWSHFNSWSAYMHLVTKPVPVARHLIHLQEQSIKDSRNLLLSTYSTSLAEGCPFHAVQNLSTHHGVRRCLQAEKPQWRLLQAYEDHGYVEPISIYNFTVHFLQSYRSHRARHQVGDGPQEQHNVDPDEEQGRKHHLHHWDHHGAPHEPHYYSQGANNRRFSYLFSFNIFKTIPAAYFQVGQTIELMKPLPIRMTLLKMEQDELHIKM